MAVTFRVCVDLEAGSGSRGQQAWIPRVHVGLEAESASREVGSGSRAGGRGGRRAAVILRVLVHWMAGSGTRPGGVDRGAECIDCQCICVVGGWELASNNGGLRREVDGSDSQSICSFQGGSGFE